MRWSAIFPASTVTPFGVRWPRHRFVFAGHAGGLYTNDPLKAAGTAGEHKAVAWPPHSERRYPPGCKALPGCLILALILHLSLAYALDPARSIRQYRLDAWSSEEVLPQLSVQCLAQTRDGYLWMGTMEGSVRFDGVRFTCFNSINTEIMSTDDVTALLQTSSGAVWMGTWGGGIFEYRDGNLKLMAGAKTLGDPRVKSLIEDRAGTIWAGTPNGIHCLKDGRWSQPDKSWGPKRLNVNGILQRKDASLWFATGDGLARQEGDHLRWYRTADGLPGNNVRALIEDKAGTLWIGTSKGLCRLRQGRLKSYQLPGGASNQDVLSLCLDRHGNLWIGTDGGGLNRMREESPLQPDSQVASIERLTTAEGLPADSVWAIVEDKEGSLWIGTFGGGLARLQESKFVTYDSTIGLPDDLVWSIYQDDDQNMYFGTDAGLAIMSGSQVRTLGVAEGFEKGGATAVLKDSRGNLWVGGGLDGLYRIKGGKAVPELKADGQPFERVYCILEDRAGTVWVATQTAGLRYMRDGRWDVVSARDGLPDDSLRVLLEDHRQGMWIGTEQSGLIYMHNGKFTVYNKQNGLQGNSIRSLYQDNEGTLWIGTSGGGLSKFANGKLSTFTTREGLFDNTVYQVLEDDVGRLWMSCNRGIFRVAKKDLDESGKASRVVCDVYGRPDGIKSSECNNGGHPAGFRTQDGRIWFPTLKGAVAIDPAHFPVNRVAPPVIIEDFRAGGNSVPLSSRPVLRPGQDNVEFHFTAPSLFAPERVSFRYQLVGSDPEARELGPGRERIAYYTNLPPGEYTFRVTACNNDGLWNDRGATVSFELRPHWHQTMWFYGALGLALVLSGGGLAHGAKRALSGLRLTRSLTHYHSRSLVETVKAGGLEQDAAREERRLLTIFFSDLTGFSDLTDRTEPERVSRLVNEYLTAMSRLINEHQGTFGRFMGDGIMAFFGAPRALPAEEQARRAVAMAIAMQRDMKVLADKWLNEGLDHDIRIRMGIAQGTVTVGHFGSTRLMQYTAVGGAVNWASRLEKNCPPGKVLVNQAVYDGAGIQGVALKVQEENCWVLDPEPRTSRQDLQD